MKKLLAAGIACATLAGSAFAAATYTIDPEYTIPNFEVEHLGFTTQRGRFDKASGKIALDFAAKKGTVEFTIHTDSLNMGSQAWTLHVASEGLFNVEKYPTMSFKSDDLVFQGDKVVAANGRFTMLGVTKPLTVKVERFNCGVNPMNKRQMCAGNVSATIKRSDFGMTKYIPTVSDDIKISVPVEAYKD